MKFYVSFGRNLFHFTFFSIFQQLHISVIVEHLDLIVFLSHWIALIFFIWIFIRILLMLSSKTAHYCSFLFLSFFLGPVFILISYPTQFHIRWHSMKLISGIMKIIWRQALIFLSLGKWLIKGKMTTTKALQELHPSLLFCHWIYSDYCTWKYSLLVRYFSGSC